jgi:hypothetical protein
MEKLNTQQISEALKDVRSAYRLLALYQKRVTDTVNYIANAYGFSFDSGWQKFMRNPGNGNRVKLENLSWGALNLYLYEFNFGIKKIEANEYHFKIVHQADSGYFDTRDRNNQKLAKLNVPKYSNTSEAHTRLIFVLSKNASGCPIEHILEAGTEKHLSSQFKDKVEHGNWMAVPYNLERFANQESADVVIKEFNQACFDSFGVSLIEYTGQ